MSFTRYLMLVSLAAALILTAACSTPPAEVPATAAPTMVEAAQPTAVEPTQLPAATQVSPPEAATPAPPGDPSIPAIVSENMAGVSVARTDPFDQMDSAAWEFNPEMVTASGGSLQITGKDPWVTALKLKRPLTERQAIMLRFQMQKGMHFGITLASGSPGTPEYRSFGFYRPLSKILARVFEGATDIRLDIPVKGDLKVHKFNTWYQCVLAISPNGHFMLLIWDPADPTKFNRIHDVFDESWMGLQWSYYIEADKGVLLLDEAVELQFDILK